MYNNPYSDETIGAQPIQYPPIEELQPRSVQPHADTYPVHTPPVLDAASEIEPIESAEIRQKKAMTVKFAIGKFNDYLLWFLMVLETTLTIRFLLKLIGADPGNLFAGFLYALTDILLLPFFNIVKSPSIHPPYQSFEFSTLIAIIIYYLIFYALRRFFRLLVSNPEEPVE
ncbi:MAG TPA: YggT family protein [Ktedonobacteraceae bacterium]|nr:YggT family protein [Ktedonobacteraceae bacterium]